MQNAIKRLFCANEFQSFFSILELYPWRTVETQQ